MRIILKIARNELRNLFYSPEAWFLTVILMVLCAFFYTGSMYGWAKLSHTLFTNRPNWILWADESITSLFFSEIPNGFFPRVLQYLYLFVPLLTMSIINREFTSGTHKLLYSSPVTLRQIVLGKYLAIAGYNLLLVSVLGIFMVSAFFDIQSLDYPLLLSGTLGIYLMLCALTAIGFFMSSLTTYPIVSAIASFTLLFILSRIGGLWQQYDVVRDLTYFLSVSGRTEKMVLGLISTKDILYFGIIIFMFVSFTLLKLKAGRETKPWYVKTASYLFIIAGGLLIGYISSRPRFTAYLDTTERKVNTIHPRTQQAIRQLVDSPLRVTLYVNLFGAAAQLGLPSRRNEYLSQMWERYQRFKTDIDYRYEYYYALPANDSSLYKQFPGKTLAQIAGIMAKLAHVDSAMFKSPEAMRRIIDLAPEDYKLIMQLQYKDRTTLLRTSFKTGYWPDEQVVNASLHRLLQTPMPKVYFVSGELERNIYKQGEREFYKHSIEKTEMGSLINIGFDIDTLNLSTQDIPTNTAVLVLADPKVALQPTVLTKLQQYIQGGGNMLIYGEPGKQYTLNPLLQSVHVQLDNGQLVNPSANETPDKVNVWFTYSAFGMAEEYYLMKYKNVWSHKVFEDTLKLPLSGVASISCKEDSGFIIEPQQMTDPGRSWVKAGKLVVDSATPVFSPLEGDIKKNSFPAVIAMHRKTGNKEQRIIISGDADLASNLRRIDDVVRSWYSWLVDNKFPVYTPLDKASDNKVTISPTRAAAQKIIYVWVLPGLVLLTGAVLLIRRKRK